MWRRVCWYFTVDKEHGFGILYGNDETEHTGQCYFEDGSYSPACSYSDTDRAIRSLKETACNDYYLRGSADNRSAETLAREASCVFTPGEKGGVDAVLNQGRKKYRIHYESGSYYYMAGTTCSCGSSRCVHIKAAALICADRLARLQHEYVVTSEPVDKTLFLEPALRDAMLSYYDPDELDQKTMDEIHKIISLADSANSTDYLRLVHEFILDINPNFGYEARFLEDDYEYVLMALFEDADYYDTVIRPGGFADQPEYYEDRQHRSNRASFKRVLKEYGRVTKELDEKEDYQEDIRKEFLLKYRGDLPSLARYYALGKAELNESDAPFLKKIAADPLTDPVHIKEAAVKVDGLYRDEASVVAFRLLMKRLSHDDQVDVYSRIRNISLSLDEIRSLSREEQLKLIDNTPLSVESFTMIMDDLLSDSSAARKGQFIIGTLKKAAFSRDRELKKVVLDKTAELPDCRLLLAWAEMSLNQEAGKHPGVGDPEKEMSTYFRCEYRIRNEKGEYTVDYSVMLPEREGVLLLIEETNGKLRSDHDSYRKLTYSAELIRKVCLEGKEEAFARELEKNQDEAAEYLFEKNNRKFITEYRSLCENIGTEKIVFTESGKASVDWMIYREEGSNALAFRVGNTKMYIVKDASEFLSAFKSGQTTEYGKDLILTHTIDNLNDTDAAAIKLLTAAKYYKGRKSDKKNKRYVTVSDVTLRSLLEILTGRWVSLNDVPCLLRMETRKIRLTIDSSYVLSSDIKKGGQEFLNLYGYGFLLGRPDQGGGLVLDRVDGSPDEINLTGLICENPGTCIKPILKSFKKNIYARFFENFDVDKAVSRDFKLSEIRLNTYFDYERSAITLETKIFKDEKEVAAKSLTERADLIKYELLQNYLTALGFADGVMEDESRILSFFKMDFTRLKTLTNVYLSERLQNKELKSIGKPVIRVTYKNDIVQVFLEKSEYNEAELEKIIAALRKKKKYILLDGNRIVDLDSEAARDLGEAVQDFGMNPKDLYRKKTISMVNAIKAFSHERSCRVDQYLRDMIEEIRSFKESEIPLPKMEGELRDYQAEGFRWLSILKKYGMGGILADDMGLGKTIQVIALIRADTSRKPSLVVCPKSLIFNWISEFTRFDGKTQVSAIYGPESARTEKIGAIDYKKKAVYITSYDSLRNDIAKYTGEFNYVILDEAQYIKNVHALKTKSVKELKAAHRFALTGTPIENSVVDLWSIFDFIMPGYFEELSRFKESDTAMIARKSAPFILRRVKEDVLEDLPPKYERILSADMSDGQRKVYDAMRMEARKRLEEGGKAFDILPYLTRLRQVCVDPGMFIEDYHSGSGKLEMLTSLIPEYLQDGHRILIFSQFVKALDSVNRILDKLGIPAYYLSGATSAKDRIEMMDSFNNGSGTDVFLISLKAGGTGLNLTGADTVIHLDPWWNVAAENQASDRTHRIGQTRNVEVIKLIAGDSIEQRVVELQDMKKEVISQVISDDDGSVTSASLEDIAFVLD